MKSYKLIVISGIALLSFTQVFTQNNPNGILGAVYSKLQKAQDYSVEANIKVDMPFIRMLPVKVKIYYKQKDKFKVESKSIAIIPRQGFDQITKMLSSTNSFTTMTQGEEKIGDVQTEIVNMIPLSDTSDVILAKLWIDPLQSIIIKSQLTTKSNGTIGTEYTYGSQVAFGLPDKMIFTVDIKKFKMPKSIATGNNKSETDKQEKSKGDKKGRIIIALSNYIVNKGIPDNVFKR
jgi:hypothetical protein